MANGDILSKIVLQAQGGDAAAQEILKVKKAYDEVNEAGAGLSGPAASTAKGGDAASALQDIERLKSSFVSVSSSFKDAFSDLIKATKDATDSLVAQIQSVRGALGGTPTPGNNVLVSQSVTQTSQQQSKLAETIGRTTADSIAKKDQERDSFRRVQEQKQEDEARTKYRRRTPEEIARDDADKEARQSQNRTIQSAHAAGALTQQVAASDFVGATASGAATAGQAAMSAAPAGSAMAKWGMAGIVAGIALSAANGLIGREEDRVRTMWATGTSQRMGTPYDSLRNYNIGLARTGVPAEIINSLLGSYSTQGGELGKGGSARVSYAAEMATGMGLDPATLGALMGTASKLGLSAGATDTRMYGLAAKSFGMSEATSFLQELNRATLSLTSLGVAADKITTSQFKGIQNTLAGYAQFGGLTSEGALSLNALAMNRGSTAGKLGGAQDIIALQEIRRANPGMSLTDAMMYMEGNPNDVNKAMFESIRRTTGGDANLMRLRAQSYLGGTMSQADAWIKTQAAMASGQTPIAMSEADLKIGGQGTARELTAVNQSNLLQGVEASLASIKAGVVSALSGINKLDATTVVLTGQTFVQQQAEIGFASKLGDKGQQLFDARLYQLRSSASMSDLQLYADILEQGATGSTSGSWMGRLSKGMQGLGLPASSRDYLSASGALAMNPSSEINNIIQTAAMGYPELSDKAKRAKFDAAMAQFTTSGYFGGATSFATGTSADAATMQKFIAAVEGIAKALQQLQQSGVITDSPRGW